MLTSPVALSRLKSKHAKEVAAFADTHCTPMEATPKRCRTIARVHRAMELAYGAYGYPALKGHMKNVGSNLKMHTLQKLTGLDVTTGVSDADNDSVRVCKDKDEDTDKDKANPCVLERVRAVWACVYVCPCARDCWRAPSRRPSTPHGS